MPDAGLPEQELLFKLLAGFIRGRWLFLSCLAAVLAVGERVAGPAFPAGRVALVGAIILSYNLVFAFYHRAHRGRPAPELRTSRVEAGVQIALDLLALTVLVHFLGGPDSPFVALYLIHGIAGGMLLSRRGAVLVAAAAFGLYLCVAVLEGRGVLPRFAPGLAAPRPPPFAHYDVALALAFLATLACSVYITTWITHGLKVRERRLVEAQEALLRSSKELEAACASLKEKQAQLVQTEKQASLGRLVAGIAHEINNPIQFIHGNMAILSEAFLDLVPMLEEYAERRPDLRVARLDIAFFRRQIPVLLKDMTDGAARIRNIVRDLRTFARRDEGAADEDVDLNETVRASIRLLHNQLKHHAVEEQLDPALPHLRGNLTQMQQVVVNALQNACQAVREGVRGSIRVRTKAEGPRLIRLSVEDNGCGMSPEIVERIFDPFFTTKQRTGGTGLGLAITDGIIQQHRGRIEVQSEPGKGTTFHFLLPTTRDGAA